MPKLAAKLIGKSLQTKRKAAGLSIRDLAQRAGCHYTAISHIECGRREPGVGLLSRIAAGLGCTLNDFIEVTLA